MAGRLLVAGATGSVGSEFVTLAVQGGHLIRTLSRRAVTAAGVAESVRADAVDAGAVRGVCDGVDTVVSCLGASVGMNAAEKRSFLTVDSAANRNLIVEARRGGARRFLYVAAFVSGGYRDTAYIRAHEEVVAALRESGLGFTVVRPTGIFSALHDMVAMARRGMGVVIGDGFAKTNPIHQGDVARVCLENLPDGPEEVAAGGPEILSRREVMETAFRAVGKEPRIAGVPEGLMRFGAAVIRPFDRRKSELIEFATAVSVTECIAPVAGTMRLEPYFRDLAAATSPPLESAISG